jgi:predicted GNAT superfamily acetyltransferase
VTLDIRPLTTVDEVRACEELQFQAWQMSDYREVVPLHMMVAIVKGGGLLLGAFDGGELLGFVFGFPGVRAQGQPKHYSHMLAVRPGAQGRGIGRRLKLAQRQAILDRGLDLVTWTYDPLESRNATLNLARLGTICRTYIRDLYGAMTDGLNAGLPTDRFEVEWWLASEHVARRLAGEEAPRPAGGAPVNVTRPGGGGFRRPGRIDLALDAPVVEVEVPADYQALKAGAPELALEWRLATRQIFETYFAAGYTVVDFTRRTAGGERRSYYLLACDLPGIQHLPSTGGL